MKEHDQDLQGMKKELRALRAELAALKKAELDREKLGQTLEEAEYFAAILTENQLDPAIIIDWDGSVLYANRAAFRLAGLDRIQDIPGLNIFQFLAPDEHEKAMKNLRLVRSGKDAFTTPYRVLTSDGSERWIETLEKKISFRGQDANLITIRDITDRIKVQDQLSERQAQLDSIFRATPTGIGVLTERVFTDVNDRICELTGYSKEELLGKSAKMLYPSDEEFRRVETEKYRRIQETGIGSVETRWVRKNGDIIDILLNSTPLIPGNLSSGVTFTALDITDRKGIENELRERQAKLDSILRAAPIGIGVVVGRTITDVNARICEISGYPRHELIGQSARIFYPTVEEFTQAGTERDRQLKEAGIGSMETRWKKKEGTVIDVFLRFSPLDPQNPHDGVTFTALDITKRKKIDQSLKENEERYRRITSAITDYIYTVQVENGKEVHTAHSPACEAVTGYTPDDFEQDPYLWYTMVCEEDRERVQRHIKQVFSNNDMPPIEHRIRRKDGMIRWVINTPVIHRDLSGEIISYDGVVSDITMRKLAEEELRESEVRFRTLHEASFGGIAIHDKGFILDCNQGLCTMTGFSKDELIDMNGLNLIAVKWRDFVMQKILSGYDKPYDVDGVKKDGSLYPIEIRGKNIPFHGKVVRVTEFRDITERKKTEQALRQSEEKLRNIIENSTNAFYSHTTDHRVTYVSPQIKKVLGYSPKESLRLWTEFVSDNPVNARGLEATEKAIRTGKSQPPYELELVAKNGKKVWVGVNESPVVVDGKTTMIVGALQDITARKLSEAALKKSEERFKGITNNLPGVVFQFYARKNGQMGLSYVSDRSREVLGIDSSEKDLFAVAASCIAPEFREGLISSIEQAVRTVGKWDYAARYIKPDGEEIFVRGISQPESPGDEIVFNGVILDITEQKRAEEALKESEERFRSMIQNSSDIIVIINDRGAITYETPSVSRILGYEPGYLIGREPYDFIHPEDIGTTKISLKEVFDKSNPGTPTEIRFRKADGSWVYLEAIGKNLIGFPGIDGVVITARNISERKKDENERIEMERRFQHAQKLESLGVMAGGIAHDFNNLLMAILGNLDLSLIDMSPDSRSKHFINQARSAARRAADLTNQMLAYSGKGKFDLKTFDLSELVEEMARLLKASISKTVTLNLQMGRNMPYMTADPAQIQQIIMNLIVNASEAIGDVPGVVSIMTGVKECDDACFEQSRLKEKPSPGLYVFIEVRDTGCGMDEQTQERLFDPFFSTKFTGRGLGMAAVLGIVRGHKGAIIVESIPDEGTAIHVMFPALITAMRLSDTGNDDGGMNEPEAEQDLPANGTILLVDDEDMVLDLCSTMIERMGYRVFTASDGIEALEVFRNVSSKIDCIILDLTMPRMGGIEAFEELKRIRGDIKVIISSGFSEQEVEHRFKGKEPVGFIKKPFELKKLRRELARVLKNHRPGASRNQAS